MKVDNASRSVLTSYVTNLQQLSWRKASVAQDDNPFVSGSKNRCIVVAREKELQVLRDCYDRVTTMERTEAVTIHGPSGVGKTALVRSFIQTLPDGVFQMEGKFNQRQLRAPYSALAAASDQLCHQIMRRENSIEIRNRIRAVLGPDVSLLGNLVQTLSEMTAEDDSRRHETTGSGSQMFTRFKLLFRAFLRCVASPEAPVVFFLDDLQWADVSSLEVLKTLLANGQSHCILLVCSYREGEMTADALERFNLAERETTDADDSSVHSRLSTQSSQITDIAIAGLDSKSFNQLISGTLGIDHLRTESLSAVLWNKTNGNPFHALNFLDMLHRRGMLWRENHGPWTWDEDRILRETNVTENLADILASRMRDLPEQVRSILQIASFIGNDFPAAALVMIVHEEQDMVVVEYSFERHSKEAIHERIVAALAMAVAAGLLETMPEVDYFKFTHDKIQEVLYETLMPDEMERQLLHQRIGTLIWDSVKSEKGVAKSEASDWHIFLAAHNLNRAVSLVDYSGSRCDLIELNLAAAKLAIGKAAFGPAADYLGIAVSLVHSDDSLWDDRYDLCIDVFILAAETQKNAGMLSRSSVLVKEISGRARSFHHHATARFIEIDSLSLQGDLKGAILLGLKVLRQLGVKFPRKIGDLAIVTEMLRVKAAMGRRSIPDLLLLPEMADETVILAFSLMNAIALKCCLVGDPFQATFVAIILRMIRLTLKFGVSPVHSPTAFAYWGAIHSVLGKFDDALQAEQLAFDVVNKFEAESVRASALIDSYCMNHFWRNALDSSARCDFLNAYYTALSYGHVFTAQTGFVGWISAGLYVDDSLVELNSTTRRVVQEIREFQTNGCLKPILPVWQVFLNMSGDTSNTNPASLTGEAVDDELTRALHQSDSKVVLMITSVCHLILGFVYEDWQTVKGHLPTAQKHIKDVEGFFTTGFMLTWIAACNYDLYYGYGISRHKRDGRRAHRRVKKWATSGTIMLVGPSTFLDAMEGLCVKNAPVEQVEILFEKAVSACAAARCRFFEALSNERLARLFRSEEPNITKRLTYLKRAANLYRSWGAVAKAEWLENGDDDYTSPSDLVVDSLSPQ
ncbi:PhoQ sensor [Fragilaria crotonensis]|nr:PhoQ sensor [Fragilaria crotonensis]